MPLSYHYGARSCPVSVTLLYPRNQDPALVRAVRPRLGLVSVGAGNRYGHPAESTLALVRSAGAQVDRTDTDGDIAVLGPLESLRMVARGPP